MTDWTRLITDCDDARCRPIMISFARQNDSIKFRFVCQPPLSMMHQQKWLASSSPSVVNKKFVSNRSNSYRATATSYLCFDSLFAFFLLLKSVSDSDSINWRYWYVIMWRFRTYNANTIERQVTKKDAKGYRKRLFEIYLHSSLRHNSTLLNASQWRLKHSSEYSHQKRQHFCPFILIFVVVYFSSFKKSLFWYLKLHMGLGVNVYYMCVTSSSVPKDQCCDRCTHIYSLHVSDIFSNCASLNIHDTNIYWAKCDVIHNHYFSSYFFIIIKSFNFFDSKYEVNSYIYSYSNIYASRIECRD